MRRSRRFFKNVEIVEVLRMLRLLRVVIFGYFNLINENMKHAYAFEKLDVWQRGRELNRQIYQLSGQLPGEEKFGIVNQVRRASVSVTCNLAEGSARTN